MSKQEILPPPRALPAHARQTTTPGLVPSRVQPGGIIDSALMRWEANRHSRTLGAVAGRTRAEADLFDAQTQLVEAYGRRQRALANLQELPEVVANEHAKRRIERLEELRQCQHRSELAEMQRMTEVAQAKAVLVDAQQALEAQRSHGHTTYDLAWKKKYCDMLDLDLSVAERRAILRQHVAELDGAKGKRTARGEIGGDVIEDALYEKRAQLLAAGLDTGRIDAVIEQRASRRAP